WQHFAHRPVAVRIEVDVDVEIAEGLPPNFGLEAFAPAVEPAAAPPGFFEGHGDAAVAAREHAFEQAAFDVVLLDLDGANPAPLPQILARPIQILARLHAVPLVRRVRLGDEVRHRRGHFDEAALHFLADARNRLGLLDDAVQIDGALARQAA